MDITCFFVEPTDNAVVALRRYNSSLEKCEVSGYGFHNAEVPIGEGLLIANEHGRSQVESVVVSSADPRWPTHCACGYAFTRSDPSLVRQTRIYRRVDTGELLPVPPHLFPAGAMWYADWHLPFTIGPDGHCLCVMTPGGEWIIDSQASNCTRPDDNVHKCWVRHGQVPLITVDKNGDTCAAGAGSILCGSYHGFLRNGVLQSC